VLGWMTALTFFAAETVTVQVFPDTLVHPLQLLKSEFASGVAVRVRTWYGVVLATTVVQPVVPPVVQEIPSPVIVPTPPPELLTLTV
jgi:hypothetical protein